jgi:hypothetical protein
MSKDSYEYDPANDKERQEMEDTKARYKLDGCTFREISNPNGKGNIVVFICPEEDVPFSSKASPVTPNPTIPSSKSLSPTPSPHPTSSGKLAWGAKVSGVFRDKVRKIAGDLGCDPNFLMAAMAFETGGSFSPSEKNKAGSGATGLIQFMPNTAIGLGTTTAALAKMSAEDQLDFVAKYFDRQKGKLHTLEDVYMAILLPTAVGKTDNHVLFQKPSTAYDQNKGLDLNNDGQVTKAEAASKVRERLVEGMKPGNVG